MTIWQPFMVIGVILTVIMAFWIRDYVDQTTFDISDKCIYMVLLHCFVMFCIATVGGIIGAGWIIYVNSFDVVIDVFILFIFGLFFLFFIPLVLLYAGECWVLCINRFRKEYSQIIFLLTYIIAIFFWYDILQ